MANYGLGCKCDFKKKVSALFNCQAVLDHASVLTTLLSKDLHKFRSKKNIALEIQFSSCFLVRYSPILDRVEFCQNNAECLKVSLSSAFVVERNISNHFASFPFFSSLIAFCVNWADLLTDEMSTALLHSLHVKSNYNDCLVVKQLVTRSYSFDFDG